MSETEKRVRKIRYALERDGVKSDARQDMDNPFSPNFLMLDARNEGDKARWWAMYGKRRARPDMAMLEKVV